MIQFDPTATNPSADRPDAFVATGTALLLAGLAGAGATAATSVYAAHQQSNAADKAAALTTSANNQQLDYLKSKDAQDQKNWEARQAENRYQSDVANELGLEQYNQREDRLAPYRGIGANANLTLNNKIGGGALPTSGIHLSIPARPGAAAPSATLPPSAANYQPLMDAINKGQSPQAVIDQYNKSQGLPNGGSYAWRSIAGAPGGGVVEIPGGSYLAPGANGAWGWNVGDSGRPASGAPASASPGAPGMQSFVDPARSSLTLNNLVPRTAALDAPTPTPYGGVSLPQVLAPYGGSTLNNLILPPRMAAYA